MISLIRKDGRWILRASGRASGLVAARLARIFSIKSFEFLAYDYVSDLKFLSSWGQLEWLRVFAPNLGSTDGINTQTQVKFLSIETNARAWLNLDNFENLETFVLPGDMFSNSTGTGKRLKKMALFSPSKKALLRLQHTPCLTSLRLQAFGEIDFCNVISPGLMELRIDDARNLSSLTRIGQNSNIESLVINCAPALRDIQDIIELQALRELEFCGCAKLYSMLPIKSLRNLRSLRIFDSRVENPDWGFLSELPNLDEFLFNQPKALGLE